MSLSTERFPTVQNSYNQEKGELYLTFKNLSYEVRVFNTWKQKKDFGYKGRMRWKKILDNCSGYAKSGETTFIMGSSGAGKTTLLNTLCDRIKKKGCRIKYSGEININQNFPVKQKTFGNYGVYVMQDDILFPTFTAEECLMFAAMLKLNKSWKECKEWVD